MDLEGLSGGYFLEGVLLVVIIMHFRLDLPPLYLAIDCSAACIALGVFVLFFLLAARPPVPHTLDALVVIEHLRLVADHLANPAEAFLEGEEACLRKLHEGAMIARELLGVEGHALEVGLVKIKGVGGQAHG